MAVHGSNCTARRQNRQSVTAQRVLKRQENLRPPTERSFAWSPDSMPEAPPGSRACLVGLRQPCRLRESDAAPAQLLLKFMGEAVGRPIALQRPSALKLRQVRQLGVIQRMNVSHVDFHAHHPLRPLPGTHFPWPTLAVFARVRHGCKASRRRSQRIGSVVFLEDTFLHFAVRVQHGQAEHRRPIPAMAAQRDHASPTARRQAAWHHTIAGLFHVSASHNAAASRSPSVLRRYALIPRSTFGRDRSLAIRGAPAVGVLVSHWIAPRICTSRATLGSSVRTIAQTVRGGGALDTDANGGHGTRPSRSSDRVRQRCVLSLGKWASVRADRPWPGGEARLGHLARMRGFFALR